MFSYTRILYYNTIFLQQRTLMAQIAYELNIILFLINTSRNAKRFEYNVNVYVGSLYIHNTPYMNYLKLFKYYETVEILGRKS